MNKECNGSGRKIAIRFKPIKNTNPDVKNHVVICMQYSTSLVAFASIDITSASALSTTRETVSNNDIIL